MSAEVDMAAVMAAANAALDAPADPQPAAGPPASLLCETGCGRPLNIVLTWVADSETRILCDVCALLLFMKIAEAIPAVEPIDDQAAGDQTDDAAEPAATD